MNSLISLENTSLGSLMLETLILVVIGLLVVWLVIVVNANTRNKENEAYSHRIKLASLNGLVIFMAIFLLYFGFFVYWIGIYQFSWAEFPWNVTNTYLQLLPQILIFLGLIISFLILNNKLSKEIKIK